MDSPKKPFKRDYAIENGDNLLPYDKFELNPQKLKLKGVLGSGAYGIVRLASLQDEFGAMMDVAVKMMKGITKQKYNTYIQQNIYIKSKKYIKEIFIHLIPLRRRSNDRGHKKLPARNFNNEVCWSASEHSIFNRILHFV